MFVFRGLSARRGSFGTDLPALTAGWETAMHMRPVTPSSLDEAGRV